MPFLPDVKESALVACGRSCCICHKFCGTKIEVHHIREEAEGGDNTSGNAIPLCFDCHADMRSYDHKHPKGNKYSESELKSHRDNWYQKAQGNIGLADRTATVETDKQIYQLLVRVLPWDGSISFIRTNNFAGFSFDRTRLDDLYEFEHHCRNPAFEFIDPDLEGLRVSLLEHVDQFTLTIATNTFACSNLDWSSVPEEWEDEQTERFHRVVTTLHTTAESIVKTYADLVRTATRKLGLLPKKMTMEESRNTEQKVVVAAQLRQHRLDARNALLEFAEVCLNYPTLLHVEDPARTSALTTKIEQLKSRLDSLGPLSMPELETLRSALVASAWNLQRLLGRQNGPDPRPISGKYTNLQDNLDGIADWFSTVKTQIKEQLDPYLEM